MPDAATTQTLQFFWPLALVIFVFFSLLPFVVAQWDVIVKVESQLVYFYVGFDFCLKTKWCDCVLLAFALCLVIYVATKEIGIYRINDMIEVHVLPWQELINF